MFFLLSLSFHFVVHLFVCMDESSCPPRPPLAEIDHGQTSLSLMRSGYDSPPYPPSTLLPHAGRSTPIVDLKTRKGRGTIDKDSLSFEPSLRDYVPLPFYGSPKL